MDVGDGPVGVVGQRVDALNREQRTFQRGHAIGGQRHHHKLEHWVLAHAIPSAAQRKQAVEHPSPRGRHEHHRKHHTERLRPVRQSGVEQVVRPGPDVDEDEAPKMDDRQAVGEHRPLSSLGQEVVHQAQVGSGQEEGHCVMAVPPLHQRVLDAGVNRIAFEETRWHRQRVTNVQESNRHRRRNVEPDSDIKVLLTALHDGAHEVDREGDPDHRDGDVDGPFQLGVLLARGQTQGQRDGRGDDDGLPTPEVKPPQTVAEHPRLAEPLQRIVDAHEHPVAHEGEDYGIGVKRPQPAKGRVLKVEVQIG